MRPSLKPKAKASKRLIAKREYCYPDGRHRLRKTFADGYEVWVKLQPLSKGERPENIEVNTIPLVRKHDSDEAEQEDHSGSEGEEDESVREDTAGSDEYESYQPVHYEEVPVGRSETGIGMQRRPTSHSIMGSATSNHNYNLVNDMKQNYTASNFVRSQASQRHGSPSLARSEAVSSSEQSVTSRTQESQYSQHYAPREDYLDGFSEHRIVPYIGKHVPSEACSQYTRASSSQGLGSGVSEERQRRDRERASDLGNVVLYSGRRHVDETSKRDTRRNTDNSGESHPLHKRVELWRSSPAAPEAPNYPTNPRKLDPDSYPLSGVVDVWDSISNISPRITGHCQSQASKDSKARARDNEMDTGRNDMNNRIISRLRCSEYTSQDGRKSSNGSRSSQTRSSGSATLHSRSKSVSSGKNGISGRKRAVNGHR